MESVWLFKLHGLEFSVFHKKIMNYLKSSKIKAESHVALGSHAEALQTGEAQLVFCSMNEPVELPLPTG